MKILSHLACVFFLTFSAYAQGAINNSEVKNVLLQKYMMNHDKAQMAMLKSETLKHGGDSVAALI